MCLLIVIHGVVAGMPLIVAANRDERRARPTIPMTRLEGAGGELAILGGRDEVGGGTWLATNEAGVVAGLTNRPLRDGPDTAKRSRGRAPPRPRPASHGGSRRRRLRRRHRSDAFNPSWLLVADRHDVFFVDVTGTDQVVVEHLRPGAHVLENRTLHEPSPKVERVRELLDPSSTVDPPCCSTACPPCSPTTACHAASHRPMPATLASPGPHEPSASMPTRTTTAHVRRPSSPSPTTPPHPPSTGPTTRRATTDGTHPTTSGQPPAPGEQPRPTNNRRQPAEPHDDEASMSAGPRCRPDAHRRRSPPQSLRGSAIASEEPGTCPERGGSGTTGSVAEDEIDEAANTWTNGRISDERAA